MAYAFFTTTTERHPWVNFEDLRKRYVFLKGQRKFGA
jgi:hypothetical protein